MKYKSTITQRTPTSTVCDYVSEYGMHQISIVCTETGRMALMTRFKHERLWHVMGGYNGDVQMRIECHDGPKTKFIKSTAFELAQRWVDDGLCYL
jgi:hypothetical protein